MHSRHTEQKSDRVCTKKTEQTADHACTQCTALSKAVAVCGQVNIRDEHLRTPWYYGARTKPTHTHTHTQTSGAHVPALLDAGPMGDT